MCVCCVWSNNHPIIFIKYIILAVCEVSLFPIDIIISANKYSPPTVVVERYKLPPRETQVIWVFIENCFITFVHLYGTYEGVHCTPMMHLCVCMCMCCSPCWLLFFSFQIQLRVTLYSCYKFNLIPSRRERSLPLSLALIMCVETIHLRNVMCGFCYLCTCIYSI